MSDASPQAGYRQIGADTYLIEGYDFRAEMFGRNLAAFRKEHPGEYLLIPRYPEYPITNDALIIKRTVSTKNNETNTITMPGLSSGD